MNGGGRKSFVSAVLLFVTAVIWGVAFVSQRVGMDYVGAFTFNGIRFSLGACSLIPVILIFEKKKKDSEKTAFTYKTALIGGLVLFTAASLQQAGIAITLSAGKAGFITGLYIVITPVLSRFLGKNIAWRVWAGAALSCAGLYLLSVSPGDSSRFGLGDLLLIACAVFWALHIIVIDRFSGKIFPLRFAAMQFAVCGALSLVCAFIWEDVTIASVYAGRTPILYSAFLSVGVAYTLQIIGQKNVEPSKAALILSAESLFGALGAAALLGEFLTARAYAGCALIFSGIVISQLRKKVL